MIHADVDAMQETSANVVFVDYLRSKGCFVQDVDGHVMLDMVGTESLPLGHNHQEFLKVKSF